MKTIIMCGGGTAGHIMPNIALLPKLRNRYRIHYIGDKNGMERDILAKYDYVTYHGIDTVKLIRKLTLKNFAIPFKLFTSIKQCRNIIRQIEPDIIFSKGGYVSVPVVIAGSMLKVPIVGHESDITMGLANKIIYSRCKCMCFSFKSTALKYNKRGLYTGSPIRPTLNCNNRNKIEQMAQFDPNKKTVMFMGGSLGARSINKVVHDNIELLTKRYNIIHITGKGNINPDKTSPNYLQLEFMNNIQDAMCYADMVVSRAGSNVIFELLYLNKPMLLIPLPKDVSRGDQILNAHEFEKNGFARVLLQSNLNFHTLTKEIEHVLKYKSGYIQKMKSEPNTCGNNLIAEQIDKYALNKKADN